MKDTLHEDRCTFLIISRPFLLRIRQKLQINQNTHFVSSNFFPKIMPFMRKRENKIVERGRPQMTVRRMRFVCWISKATDTLSEYVILIAFPQQHWQNEMRLNVPLYVDSLCYFCNCRLVIESNVCACFRATVCYNRGQILYLYLSGAWLESRTVHRVS